MSLRTGCIPALLLACLACASGPDGALEPVEELGVLSFAERAGSFYALLEGERMDAMITFEDADLRSYFENERGFSDYYAQLANALRDRQFRHTKPDRVVIREFRIEEGSASVDIRLVGKHMRGLIFWDQELEFTDVWRLEGGTWFVSPDKL